MNYSNLELTIIIPLFITSNHNKDLEHLIKTYEGYSLVTRRKIHFVFVDDHSPVKLHINSTKLNYTLYRITDNIMWNQGGARNLGVTMAKTAKLILTDLDHIFPEKTITHLLKRKIPTHIFKFKRIREEKKQAQARILFSAASSYF